MRYFFLTMISELKPVYDYLRTLVAIEPADLAPLVGKIDRSTYPAHAHVFREGESFTKVTFLLEGLVKKYYLTSNGKEFIKEFTWEGQVTTPYASLLRKGPTTYSMETLEPTTLLTIEYSEIEALYPRSLKWMELGKAFADLHFLNREDREMELLKYSATERYAIFRDRFPGLLDRLRKQDIANYLGITPVAFSRILAVPKP